MPRTVSGEWLNTYNYVGGNPIIASDAQGLIANAIVPIAIRVIGGRAAGAAIAQTLRQTMGPAGTILACIATGYCSEAENGDSSSEEPVRGLPPEGILPPIPNAGECKSGPASRPSEQEKGGQSLWDPDGGEWRWHPGDRWHNPHWDHNPHDRPNSPWVNVPQGDLPPVKTVPDPR